MKRIAVFTLGLVCFLFSSLYAEGKPGSWKYYEHVGKQFKISLPAHWNAVVKMEDAEPRYAFTPEEKKSWKGLKKGFYLWYHHLTRDSAFKNLSLDRCYSWYVPRIRARFLGLAPQEGSVDLRIGENENILARRWTWAGKREGRTAREKMWFILARDGRKLFVLLFFAPQQEFRALKKTYVKILKNMYLREHYAFRKKKALNPQALIDKYKGSVVQVKSGMELTRKGKKYTKWYGTGTGFIIREDGYILTNHHVVWNRYTKSFYKKFLISWDHELSKKYPAKFAPVEAELVWAHGKQRWSLSEYLTAPDIALLKIKNFIKYKPLPITPSADVKLGDPCITMGFPKASLFQKLSMFVTRGVVVRFNTNQLDMTTSVFTDAKITHGNSGGPCINLATGGVLGVNTFVFKKSDLMGYYGVVSIDTVLSQIPQYFHLPADYKSNYNFLDYYQIGYDYYRRGQWKSLDYILTQIFKRNSYFPEAYYLKGVGLYGRGKKAAGIKELEKNIQSFPKHYPSLIFLARAHYKNKGYIQVSKYLEKAMKANPQAIEPYLLRAKLNLQIRKFDEALVDARMAAKLSHGYWVEPHLLAGEILASQGKFEASRREYRRALAMDPHNTEARLVLGRYYEKKEMYEAAIIEYGKVLPHSPLSVQAREAVGHCYMKLKQYTRAFSHYQKALVLAEKKQVKPSKALFLSMAWVAEKVEKSTLKALKAYIDYLQYYGEEKEAYKVHLEMARLFDESNYSDAMAFAHFLLAQKLNPKDKEVISMSAEISPNPLRMRDFRSMLKYGYPASIIVAIFKTTYVHRGMTKYYNLRMAKRYLRTFKGTGKEKEAIYKALRGAKRKWAVAKKKKKDSLRLITGDVRGTYYKLGQSLSRLAPSAYSGLKLKVLPSSGTAKNLTALSNDKADLAFIQLDSLNEWMKRYLAKRMVKKNLRIITPICREEVHILVRKGSKISSLKDLYGKKIHMGPYYSGTLFSALNLLRSAGYSNFKLRRMIRKNDTSLPKRAFKKLLNNELDAMFYTVGAPAALFSKLPANVRDEIRIMSFSDQKMAQLKKKFPKGYKRVTLKKGTYPWLKKDVQVPSTLCLLVAKPDVSSTKVDQILNLIYDNQKKLTRFHSKWGDFNLALLHRTQGQLKTHFHKGTRKFLAEHPYKAKKTKKVAKKGEKTPKKTPPKKGEKEDKEKKTEKKDKEKKPVTKKSPKEDKITYATIMTGHHQGTYYKMGKSLSHLFKDSDFRFKISSSKGTVANVNSLIYQRADFAFIQEDALRYWLKKARIKRILQKNIRMVTPICREEVHILVRKKAGIKSIGDLKNKKVYMGKRRSGTRFTAVEVILSSGMKTSDVRSSFSYSSPSRALKYLIQGKLDAMFYTIGAPSSLFQKLSQAAGENIEFLSLDKKAIEKIEKNSKLGYKVGTIKADTYPWLEKDVQAMTTQCFLITTKKMDSKKVGQVLNAIYKNQKKLGKRHPKWKDFNLNTFHKSYKKQRDLYHKGAKAFLKAHPPEKNPEKKKGEGDKKAPKTTTKKDGGDKKNSKSTSKKDGGDKKNPKSTSKKEENSTKKESSKKEGTKKEKAEKK